MRSHEAIILSNADMPKTDHTLAIDAETSERLSSWKEIAAFLKVSVRTAQRWERTASLPAHRHHHRDEASGYAYRAELEQWWSSRPRPLLESRVSRNSPR